MVDPGKFPAPALSDGLRQLERSGWVPSKPAAGVLGFVDPLEDINQRLPGEGPEGLEIMHHPEAALRDDPELWEVVDRYRAGVPLDITAEDYEQLSAWEIDARLIMLGAHNREKNRMLREQKNGQ